MLVNLNVIKNGRGEKRKKKIDRQTDRQTDR